MSFMAAGQLLIISLHVSTLSSCCIKYLIRDLHAAIGCRVIEAVAARPIDFCSAYPSPEQTRSVFPQQSEECPRKILVFPV